MDVNRVERPAGAFDSAQAARQGRGVPVALVAFPQGKGEIMLSQPGPWQAPSRRLYTRAVSRGSPDGRLEADAAASGDDAALGDREVARCWESNARAWTELSRQGWDVYRDALNTPAFLAMLSEIGGRAGIDIGCGEGHNTRLLAARGARMIGVDLVRTFVEYARAAERENPSAVQYLTGSASRLPFAPERFDFATAFMSLMDMPRPEAALGEAWRVLRSGGFLQFSILHPCFFPPHREQLRNEQGEPHALELGRYFERMDGRIDRWMFSAAPPATRGQYAPFQIPRYHRTLSEWLNAVLDAGFTIERLAEPYADDDTARRVPQIADTRIAAYYLHVRCRKA
jgi:ubiquinone/menaquinone biosynthesis C-methylase UbiE